MRPSISTTKEAFHADTRRNDLTGYLYHIWHTFFSDTPCVNEVHIAYSYPWKNRLGLIQLSPDNLTTFIGINTLLQYPQVPEHVLLITIAHELVHYKHGFGSPLPRCYKHPHANKVVDHELEAHGLAEPLRLCKTWISQHWYAFYDRFRLLGQQG